MLLTGLEALLASRARRDQATAVPEVRQSLERLRFGSSGAKVARLRAYLGLSAGDDFDLEAALKVHSLHQQTWSGASDGIFTPALDQALGAWVFSEKPAEPAVVPSETESFEEPTVV
jgi:murein L,D-transpeptidase YcbB/YkuD